MSPDGIGDCIRLGESSQLRSKVLPTSPSWIEGTSVLPSGHAVVDCVRIEAASPRPWEASELLQVRDGALVLLRRVLAEKVEAREGVPKVLRAQAKLETP